MNGLLIVFSIDDKEFETEADKYRASGMYTTDIGGAMLLALSNGLHLPPTCRQP